MIWMGKISAANLRELLSDPDRRDEDLIIEANVSEDQAFLSVGRPNIDGGGPRVAAGQVERIS